MTIRNKRRLALVLFGTLTVSFMASAQNPVTDWNNIAITTAFAASQVTASGSNAPGGSIIYLTYVHLAIYDAVNAIDHRFEVTDRSPAARGAVTGAVLALSPF